VTAANGSSPDQLPVDVQQMLAYLTDLHAQQLATVNLEAAKWRTAAVGAQQRVNELTARLAELEDRKPATVAGGLPDLDD
jgi:hypothetical protein